MGAHDVVMLGDTSAQNGILRNNVTRGKTTVDGVNKNTPVLDDTSAFSRENVMYKRKRKRMC